MTFDNVFPAGTICDFDFHNVLTVSDSAAIFPDRMIDRKYSVNLWDLDSQSVAELRKRPTAPRDDRIFTIDHFVTQATDTNLALVSR